MKWLEVGSDTDVINGEKDNKVGILYGEKDNKVGR